MTIPLFSGSMVALVTPFKDGKVDETALRRHIDWQIENGTSALIPCGTTGEASTLSYEEHDRVIELTVEQANRRVKVLAGTGSNATDEAISLTRNAKSAGADGALLVNPYYNKPTQEGLYQHFKAIAEAVPNFPLVLYNIPGRTGISMSVETTLRLSQIDTIVGIKEASASLVHASEIIQACGPNFALYSGEDALNWPLYAIGAHGAISVTANILPKLCAEMWSASQSQNFARAREIHFQLLAINQALFWETNPIPVKTALALMNRCREEFRLPLVPMQKETREKLKKVLEGYGVV